MPVNIGNNSQLNNSPVWAVLSPVTVTTAMSNGQPSYRPNTELGIGLENCAASVMLFDAKATARLAARSGVNGLTWIGNGVEQRFDDSDSKQTLANTPAVSKHSADSTARYQPNSSVLRPGELKMKINSSQAVKAGTQH